MLVQLLQKRTIETTSPANPATWLTDLWAGSTTSNTGAIVSPSTALTYSAVFACVRILAESIASLPLILYERLERGKQRADSHRLYGLLHDAPNPEMTRAEFWEAMVGHNATWGNAYAEIEYDSGGRVIGLWPLRPDYMTVSRVSGVLWYDYTVNSQTYRLPAYRVLHLRGLGGEGIMGYSPIYMAREAIGLGLATEKYGATFFGNDARPGGILRHPGQLKPATAEKLRTSWNAAHSGLDYAHRVAVLEEGIEWQAIGLPNEDAQFLETRKFQVTEIARWFRIPPHMLADLDRATFSNIEHQSLEFVIHTLRPWLVRIEQRLNLSLLSEVDRKRYFCEHLVDGLLRGDIASRYAAYATGRQNGWLSADDIRELENMNPLPDGQGEIYLVPMNMTPADQAGKADAAPEPDPEPEPAANEGRAIIRPGRAIITPAEIRRRKVGSPANRQRIAKSYRKLIADATSRILRRERADVLRQAEKTLAKGDVFTFLRWLEPFYADHRSYFERQILPIIESLSDQIGEDALREIGSDDDFTTELEEFVRDYTASAAKYYTGSNEGQLRKVIAAAETEEADPMAAIEGRFDEWEEKTPGKEALYHSVRGQNAIAKQTWIVAGIVRFRWVTNANNCPYCDELEGRVVGIEQHFLSAGEAMNPKGASSPLVTSGHIGHAPLHGGCDCGIAAER
ncbi:MAG: portal protein [Phage 5P_3]|nr:MAG: portal protein [Phage 5P_3]